MRGGRLADAKGRGKTRSLEESTRRRARRGSIERAVIGALLVGAGIPIAAMAPKVLSLIREEHLDAILPPDPRQRLRETIRRMRRKGLVDLDERGGRRYPRLTKKGIARAQRMRWETARIKKPRRWDGRWRVVIFDIPHKRRAMRDHIRAVLKRMGFIRLQNSVWVHPYDCEELITLLKLDMRLRTEVLYLICDAIEYDKPLREHFRLPRS